MRVSDYPFNRKLLIGSRVQWIPTHPSSAHERYKSGTRWEYIITGFDDKRFTSTLIYLKDEDGTSYSFSRLEMLELLGLED
jgi:hypothetical protein